MTKREERSLVQLRDTSERMRQQMKVLAIDAMREAVKKAGGQTELAKKLPGKVNRQMVNNWCKRGAPVAMCLHIEKATGISAERLAPFENWAERRAAAKSVAGGAL